MKRIDLAGKRVGKLLVIEETNERLGKCVAWRCACDCGNEKLVSSWNLKIQKTRSCGCLVGEAAAKGNATHGASRVGKRTPEYATWSRMKERCSRKKNPSYRDYGGRGIRVCDRWMKFENFLADMGQRPSPNHSIDRIDNNGNYEPPNCRWATATEQRRNRRNVVKVLLNGESMCLAELCRRTGIGHKRARKIADSGMDASHFLSF